MNRLITRSRGKRQSGVAAVELAILCPILLFVLTVPIFFGRYFWHYTVVHKAAADAARYLSTISEAEMRTSPLAQAAGDIARGIAEEEIADLKPGRITPKIAIHCGSRAPCQGIDSAELPETVVVAVEVSIFDTIFGVVPTGARGMLIKSEVEVPYVGN